MANRSSYPTNIAVTEHKMFLNGKPVTLKVKSSSNAVQLFADGSIWDTVANKFVAPEDTNVKEGK